MNDRQISIPEIETPLAILVGKTTHEIVELPLYGSYKVNVINGVVTSVEYLETGKPNIV